MTERLDERLARLERERLEADRLYNDALTALDRALGARPVFPPPAAPYDASKLAEVNRTWDTLGMLPGGAPAADRSLKGRIRAFIWHLVGPPLEQQREFNAALVDHLNRNVAAHEQGRQRAAELVTLLERHLDAQIAFQARLLGLFQTVTLYVDTKDRATGGGHEALNATLSAVTDTWLKRWESLKTREDRSASSLADVRATASLAQTTALSLKREVEKLVANERLASDSSHQVPVAPDVAVVPDLNAFKYLGFEDQFRGSQEDITRRLSEYVPLFQGQSDVLDLGCGRGEFLSLLADAGISARGLDVNLAMVEECRKHGLDVAQGDALGHLSSLPDGSLGGVFAAQVVEHFQPEYLAGLLEAAAHKVRPGGLIVLETINPACWVAFFESYIRDLTHVRPLHPETLQYLLRVSGFQDVTIAYKSPIPEANRLEPLAEPPPGATPDVVDLVTAFNENVRKLNERLFTYQDYAAIGRRI